jgi:hypothetical protein
MAAHKHCLSIRKKHCKEESQEYLAIRGFYNVNWSCKVTGDNSNYGTQLAAQWNKMSGWLPYTHCVKELPSANGIFTDVVHVDDDDDGGDDDNNVPIRIRGKNGAKEVQSIIKIFLDLSSVIYPQKSPIFLRTTSTVRSEGSPEVAVERKVLASINNRNAVVQSVASH